MKIFKLIVLLFAVLFIASCTPQQVNTLPTATPQSTVEVLPDPIENLNCPIPYDSDEYNQILESYVYGKWVIARIVIEPDLFICWVKFIDTIPKVCYNHNRFGSRRLKLSPCHTVRL